MTSNGGENHAPDNGVEHHKVTVVRLAYDHDTCLVSFDAKDVPIGLLQMMVDETRRQLDILRRQAAARQMQDQMREAATNAALAESIFGGAGKKLS